MTGSLLHLLIPNSQLCSFSFVGLTRDNNRKVILISYISRILGFGISPTLKFVYEFVIFCLHILPFSFALDYCNWSDHDTFTILTCNV